MYNADESITKTKENPREERMRYVLGGLLHNVAPLIQSSIPSVDDLKAFLRRCTPDIKPLLRVAESFDDVMEIIEDKCSVRNIIALEETVAQYKIEVAKSHISQFYERKHKECKIYI